MAPNALFYQLLFAALVLVALGHMTVVLPQIPCSVLRPMLARYTLR